MDKHDKWWNTIYHDFVSTFPFLEKDVLDWYPSGRMEITLRMTDESKFIFNYNSKSFRRLNNYNLDENGIISESDCRKEFSIQLQNKMDIAGLNSTDLAYRTGISQVMISKYINQRATPSLYNIRRLACVLKCLPEELIGYEK